MYTDGSQAERFQGLINGPIFERLNREKPGELKKLDFVEGSLDAPGPQLGTANNP